MQTQFWASNMKMISRAVQTKKSNVVGSCVRTIKIATQPTLKGGQADNKPSQRLAKSTKKKKQGAPSEQVRSLSHFKTSVTFKRHKSCT